jgi:hypothetical protein
MRLTANDWLKIASDSGYVALPDGRIIGKRGKELKLAPQSRGYLVFSVPYEGKSQAVPVHRFVAYTKFGEELFNAECVRHLDGNPHNNSFDNIALGSIKDNYHDMDDELKRSIYEGRGRFRTEDISRMKELRNDGFLLKEIGEKFGISYSMVGMILRGDCYKGGEA